MDSLPTLVIKMFMLKAVNLILKKIQGVLYNYANSLKKMLLAKCSPRRQHQSDAAQAGGSVGGVAAEGGWKHLG